MKTVESVASLFDLILGEPENVAAPYAHIYQVWKDGTFIRGYPQLQGCELTWALRVHLSDHWLSYIAQYVAEMEDALLKYDHYRFDLDPIIDELEQTRMDALAIQSGLWLEVKLR